MEVTNKLVQLYAGPMVLLSEGTDNPMSDFQKEAFTQSEVKVYSEIIYQQCYLARFHTLGSCRCVKLYFG